MTQPTKNEPSRLAFAIIQKGDIHYFSYHWWRRSPSVRQRYWQSSSTVRGMSYNSGIFLSVFVSAKARTSIISAPLIVNSYIWSLVSCQFDTVWRGRRSVSHNRLFLWSEGSMRINDCNLRQLIWKATKMYHNLRSTIANTSKSWLCSHNRSCSLNCVQCPSTCQCTLDVGKQLDLVVT